eukprot:gnl/MRDRNA2_/MRDRNA2_73203_c0_seq1.p2 gnl/MRDRNA2_/MRDRNA2_73203_c0~~gnl/MRDRNA2_/MRDRNA2_73203_c0_seq1.p2  ORF type:complete len:115 (+),score=10.89 gnl/MRDRNA2_/MRDRNA2_73203_c0_seq1:348-692(+)
MHESHLDHIHLSASWTTFGRLARRSVEQFWLQGNAEVLDPLVKHTVQAARMGEIGARQLANIACGAAHSSGGKRMGMLFIALARAMTERSIRDFNPLSLANAAWAFAKVGHRDE